MKTLASTIKQSTQQKGGMKNKEREREREHPSLGQESKTQRVHRNKLCFIKHKKHIGKKKGRETFLRAISLERALIATMMQTKIEVTCIFYKAINTLYLEVTCVLYTAADTLC